MQTLSKFRYPALLLSFSILCACSGSDDLLPMLDDPENFVPGTETEVDDLTNTDTSETEESDTGTTDNVDQSFTIVDSATDYGVLEAPIQYNIDYADTFANSQVYANQNNSARLSGPVVGDGSTPNQDILKPLNLHGPTDSVQNRIIAAYATQSRIASDEAKIVVVIQNPSSEMFCDRVWGVSAIHTDTNAKYEYDNGKKEWDYYPDGASFQTSIAYVDSDCIPAGGISYGFRDFGQRRGYGAIEPVLWLDETTGITGGRSVSEVRPSTMLPVTGSVKPISYSLSDDGLRVEILVENQDPVFKFQINQTSVYMLDEQGMPIGHVQALDGVFRLDPGESGIVSFPQQSFAGSSSTLRVVVDPIAIR